MKGVYNEHKKVYRVNNADGSFSTYTPEQYRALNITEDAEVIESETLTETEVHRPDFAQVQFKTEDGGQDGAPIEDEDADVVIGDGIAFPGTGVHSTSNIPLDETITTEHNPQS